MIELSKNEIPQKNQIRKRDLTNFLFDCTCGFALRFHWYDQVRVCTRCGSSVSLPIGYQSFLKREKAEKLRWLAELEKKMEGPQ